MENLPLYLVLFFTAITLVTIAWFYVASKSRSFLLVALIWSALQSVLAWQGFYENTETLPPRLFLGMLPVFLAILILFLTRSGKAFMDKVNLETITWLHTIRIPVEIVLALYAHLGLISFLQTFEGTNFDIFSGVTAPVVAYLVFRAHKLGSKALLAWNIICLLLLLNVVITSALAVPYPFQQLSFNQPNIGVLFFPLILLPTVVVPVVLLSHLITIRRLTMPTLASSGLD